MESTEEIEVIGATEKLGKGGVQVYEFEYTLDSIRGGMKRIFSVAFVDSKKLYLLNIAYADQPESPNGSLFSWCERFHCFMRLIYGIVLAELPSPVIGGTVFTVEDLQQKLKCNINIKHRDEFDEEKEPDGMVLSGWTGAPQIEKDNGKLSVANGGSISSTSQSTI